MTTLSLSTPLALLLLPLPLLVWFFAPPHRHRVRATRVPFFRTLTQAAGVEAQHGALILRRSTLQMIAACLAWALLVLALAGPERLGEPIVTENAARDTVLALDISGSMDERDFVAQDGTRKQRLEAVTDVLRPFIAERDGDRMALIVFGTRAFVQAPFTDDLQSLNGFLDQTQVGMAGPNTALGDAIGLAIRTFQGSEIEERLMILLSDGGDTSSTMTPGQRRHHRRQRRRHHLHHRCGRSRSHRRGAGRSGHPRRHRQSHGRRILLCRRPRGAELDLSAH